MADIKWSAFPSVGNTTTGDIIVGLRAGANVQFSSGSLMSWTGIAGTTQAAVVNVGYVNQAAGTTTVTLPAVAALGSLIAIQGLGSSGWIMTANAGQTIKIGNATTTIAGSLASVDLHDSVEVVCIVANTTWSVTRVLSAGLTIS